MAEMRTAGLLAVLCCVPACLELNPEFAAPDEAGSSGSSDASESGLPTEGGGSGESGSSTGADSSAASSTTAMGCVADDLEPNEDMDAASDANDLGFILSATLDSAFDLDWYKGVSNPDSAGELFVRTTPLAFRACIYIECKSTLDAPTIDKCSGVLDTAANGQPGCCGPGVAAIEYTCSEGLDVEFHARIDDPAASQCAPYEVEIGTI